jgi:membrane-bound serine protease (ClpP class)
MGTLGSDQKPDETMTKKLENFATSYIEAIANRRGRNVDWAKSAVKDSASITAEKALEMKVIEIIAKDLTDLLRQLDGREWHGRRLRTTDAAVVEIPMRAGERTFQLLWRPEVVFFLMLLAIYGIIGELSSPGAVLPGVVGAIALVLVLYMSAVLPLNIAGLALIGVALGLFVVDVFASTHGVLTGGGIIAFLLGALMLFDRAEPSFRLSLVYIIPATVITAAFFTWVVGAGLRAQFLPVRTGHQAMLGRTAAALGRIDAGGGRVFVEGEYWNAVSDTPVEPGQPVEIVALEGLTLKVKPRNP